MKVDYPGIGGSLGECVLCGESFALEVMFGRSVPMLGIENFERDLPVHQKCLDSIEPGGPWEELPEGPLRREYALAFEKEPQQ